MTKIFEHTDIDGDRLELGRTSSRADRDRGQNWYVSAAGSTVLLDDGAMKQLTSKVFAECYAGEAPKILPPDGDAGLSLQQASRIEIAKASRDVLAQRGIVSSGALTPYDVIILSRYIETGDDPTDDEAERPTFNIEISKDTGIGPTEAAQIIQRELAKRDDGERRPS